jgi:hypothetical protein
VAVPMPYCAGAGGWEEGGGEGRGTSVEGSGGRNGGGTVRERQQSERASRPLSECTEGGESSASARSSSGLPTAPAAAPARSCTGLQRPAAAHLVVLAHEDGGDGPELGHVGRLHHLRGRGGAGRQTTHGIGEGYGGAGVSNGGCTSQSDRIPCPHSGVLQGKDHRQRASRDRRTADVRSAARRRLR